MTEQLIVSNPMPLEYQFQPDDPSRREAADPVCFLYGDAYYLFASKSYGYWRSTDLAKWQYIPCRTIKTINEYAPTVMEHDGYLYFLASDVNRLWRNRTPEQDTWEEVTFNFPYSQHDPYLFRDDDGRVYMFWGCSDIHPIVGSELDPNDGFRPIGVPDTLIGHHAQDYGWEQFGPDNNGGKEGWNEGAALIKHKGRYYLQYAGNGTEFRVYGDGCYVSDRPLGPYTYLEESPFSFKPGGFIAGAGHGDTFRDRNGRYWHVATLRVSQRHMFERRLELLPVTFDDERGPMAHTAFTDYPFDLNAAPTDAQNKPLMNLLSMGKTATASSALPTHDAMMAVNEQVEDWWSATTGNEGEWLAVDLGRDMQVEAIQVNFADEGFRIHGPEQAPAYRYILEGSADGQAWSMLDDFSQSDANTPHRLHLLKQPATARYVRITNCRALPGNFSLFGFRVFGRADIQRPTAVKGISVNRDEQDPRHITLTWTPVASATGYLVEWGRDDKHLTHAATVPSPMLDGRWFNRDATYVFRVRAYNEAGLGKE